MTIAAPPPGLQPDDYDEIEAAVMETARGRWFLAEYARRVRGGETARVLSALERLEARLEAQQALAPLEAFSLSDRLIELSWSLRERGVEDFVCGKIDALAREFRGAGEVAGRGERQAREAGPVAAPGAEPAASAPQPDPVDAEIAPALIVIEEAAPVAPPPLDPRLSALSWLDSLPLVDRLALFA